MTLMSGEVVGSDAPDITDSAAYEPSQATLSQLRFAQMRFTPAAEPACFRFICRAYLVPPWGTQDAPGADWLGLA